MSKTVVVFADPPNHLKLANNKPPKFTFSHSRYLLHVFDLFVKAGYKGYISQGRGESQKWFKVQRTSPETLGLVKTQRPARSDVNLVLYPPDVRQTGGSIKQVFPGSKTIWVVAAVHWLEQREFFDTKYAVLLREFLAECDAIVTQSPYMAQALLPVTNLVADWSHEDRVFSVLGDSQVGKLAHQLRRDITEKQKAKSRLGFEADIKLIVSSGGAWEWTDIDSFAKALSVHSLNCEGCKIRFLQLGLAQSDNLHHKKFTRRLSDIARQLEKERPGVIQIIKDWDVAGSMLVDGLAGADFGLSISKRSLESFQAIRQRHLDYIFAGIPVIRTSGDYFDSEHLNLASLIAAPGSLPSYQAILENICSGKTQNFASEAKSLRTLALKLSKGTPRPLIESISGIPSVHGAASNLVSPPNRSFSTFLARLASISADYSPHWLHRLFMFMGRHLLKILNKF